LALLSAYAIRHTLLPVYFPNLQPLTIASRYLYILMPFTYISLLLYERMYTKRLPFWQCAERVFKVCMYAIVLDIGIMYFTGAVKSMSRIFIGTSWVLSFGFLILGRFFTKRMMVTGGLWQKPVIIVGAGKTAELLAKAFEDEPNMGYKIVGIIEDNFAERRLVQHYPLLGSFANAERAVACSGIQDVIIAAPGLEREKLQELVYRIQPYVNNVSIIPNLFGVPVGNMEAETLFNHKAVLLRVRNNMASVWNRMLKRTFDLFASIIGLICICPALIAVAILIYLSSPGPVIFAHNRTGKDGKVFPCYKFRSMITNAQEVLEQHLAQNPAAKEEWDRDFKLKDDPRITKIGHFIRKTSIDELPQLFNVIKGEMSLVGPRPIIDKEISKYGAYINDYYLGRPGITGFWQVSGRNDVDYESRVQMDSWYVRNWSFWLDIVLLLKTVGVVLYRKGAY
jgi:Undecaprenyl-phosphate galactose phosphotransferase WbaP